MNELMQPPQPGDRQGDWVWDGTRWTCDPCDDDRRPPRPWPPTHGPQPPFRPPWFDPPQPPWYPGANAGVSFGLTAPANPVRGHFWYNGTNLSMFDGAAWVSIGGGTAGGGTPPAVNPPTNPQPGQQWFDGTTLWIWDGVAWVPVAGTKTFVQATAPPAPVPGDLWFDGTQLRVWSGTAWMLVGPGATVGPVPTSTVVFSIHQSGYFAAPANWDIVTITATPTIDPQSGWDTATKRWTPTKAGFYLFQCTVWAGATGGLALVKNDTGTWTNDQNHPALGIDSVAASAYLQITALASMNGTTDFIRLFGYCSSGQYWGNPSPPLIEAILMP